MEAFENAITTVIALEGSTNAVLHLLAIAHAAGVPLAIDDFTRIGERTPVLADMRPAGQYAMSELIAIGGIQPLMKMLLEAGLLHGDCLTVTGRTLAENLAAVAPYPAGPESHPAVVRPHQEGFPPGDPLRQPGARRRRRQDHRPRGHAASPAPPAASTARRPPWKPSSPATGREGRRGRGALRGPQRRPRHARDALAHQRHQRPRALPGRGAHHRRPLLRRLPRLRHRPRHPRSVRRRADRPHRGWRPDHRRRREQREITLHVAGRRARRAAGALAAAAALCPPRRPGQVRAPGELRQRRRGDRQRLE